MSLCYDGEKRFMITIASVAISLTVGFVLLSLQFAQGQEDNQTVRTESDFYLEANAMDIETNNVFLNTINPNELNITKFELRGDALKSICPSGQCRIEYNKNNLSDLTSEFFTKPSLDAAVINFDIPFTLKDDATNSSIGPIKKHYLEEHSSRLFGCTVTDVIEDNGQEVYYCNKAFVDVIRDFDRKIWNFDTTLKYDAKKHILLVYGNYTE